MSDVSCLVMKNSSRFVLPVLGLLCLALWLLTNSTAVDSVSVDEESCAIARRPHDSSAPSMPAEADFCGEFVPLDRPDIYESLEREVITNTFWHSNTLLLVKRSGRYFPLIEPILKEYGVPDDMKYLCAAESNLVPTVKSPAGALGLWQFMEATAKEYGLRVTDEIDERADPVKSTRAACRMLLSNFSELHSWSLVAASYNGGLARVKKVREQQHQSSYYDLRWAEETGRYVFRCVALKAIMSSPGDFGFCISDEELYRPYQCRSVEVSEPISDLAQWAIEHGTTYKMLRLLNPWIQKNKLSSIPGGTLCIQLPQ